MTRSLFNFNFFLSISCFETRTYFFQFWSSRWERELRLRQLSQECLRVHFCLFLDWCFQKKAANFSNFLKIFYYKSHFPDENENIFLSRNSILEREYLSVNLVLKMTTKNRNDFSRSSDKKWSLKTEKWSREREFLLCSVVDLLVMLNHCHHYHLCHTCHTWSDHWSYMNPCFVVWLIDFGHLVLESLN